MSISRNEWILTKQSNILKNKDALVEQYIFYMLDRTQEMFEYRGLPESIPPKDLELILQVNGNCTITKVGNDLYAFYSGLGGKPNPYYLPTLSIVANPALEFNKTLEIHKDCVVIPNDAMYVGLMPMFNKYANLLAECDISLRFAAINARIPSLISADNDATKADAVTYLKQIADGAEIGVIGSNSFFEGIKTAPYLGSNTPIKELLELMQYIKAHWFNELGLQANYNMKREAINSSESALNEDVLLPLIDQMLKRRKEGFDEVNKLYGTSISVKLSNAWEQLREEMELSLEKTKADIESTKGENDIAINKNDKEEDKNVTK